MGMNVSLSNWVKIQSGFYYSVSYKTCFYNQSWTELLDNSCLCQIFFFFFFYCSAHYQSCDLVICAKQSWWDSFPVICLQDMRTKSHHRCSLRNNMFVNSWSIVVDIKLTWAERGSSTSAVRVTLYSAVTLFSLLHNSCWPLSLRKPP